MSKAFLGAALAAATLAAGLIASPASAYPTKPVTIVVPFPAGAGPDVLARLIGEQLGARLKQSVVVENRPGASGFIGATAVARAAADGHTLLLTPNTLFIAPHVMAKGAKPPVDVLKDLVPVIMPSQTTMVMVANPKLGVKNARELAELARSKPGLSYASSGAGSVLHFGGELFTNAAKVNILHVPYRGIAPAINDVIAGHVHVTISGIGPLRAHLASGALVALATVEAERSKALPDLPTAIEQGFPGVAVNGWYAVLAPAGTPSSVIALLNKEINAVLEVPVVRDRLAKAGEIILGGSPESLGKRMKADFERYGEIAQRLKITAE